jgi:hypothetical protein
MGIFQQSAAIFGQYLFRNENAAGLTPMIPTFLPSSSKMKLLAGWGPTDLQDWPAETQPLKK